MKPWGTIYLMRPDWDGSDEDIDRAVVEAYEPVKSFLDVAIELWRLADDDKRASAIESLLEDVYEREQVIMTTAETNELLQLLEGLEAQLVGKVIDDKWMVQSNRLSELRARTETLNLDESRGHLAVHAVGEGLCGVLWLQKILREALERGLLVSLN